MKFILHSIPNNNISIINLNTSSAVLSMADLYTCRNKYMVYGIDLVFCVLAFVKMLDIQR